MPSPSIVLARPAVVLPLEITQAIVQFALPPVCETTFQRRYEQLSVFLTVSRAFSQVALRELYRHVKLATPRHAKQLLHRVNKGRPDESAAAAQMESLRIGEGRDPTRYAFPIVAVLVTCPGLKELSLVNIESVEACTLSIAVELTELTLRNMSLTFPEDTYLPYLPNLISLAINDIVCLDRHDEAIDVHFFLNPTSVPSLTFAALSWFPLLHVIPNAARRQHESDMLVSDIGTIGPQLRALVIGRHDQRSWSTSFEEQLRSCSSLEHLTVNNPVKVLDRFLRALPAEVQLRTLQIGAWYLRETPLRLDVDVLLPMFEDPPYSVLKLEKLSIPEVWDWAASEGAADDTDVRSARDIVRSRCAEMNIELIERPLNSHGMDEMIEDWKQLMLW